VSGDARLFVYKKTTLAALAQTNFDNRNTQVRKQKKILFR